jgi:hypothetical protein
MGFNNNNNRFGLPRTNSLGQWSLPYEPTMEDFTKSYVEKYNSELKKTEASLFQRFEDKYILPKSLKDELQKTLAKHLQPDYPDKKTKYTTMRSVYFDSANLDMIQHHLSKADSRFKVRTREYAPNGELAKTDFTYLEVKAKHGDVSDKFRIKVPNEDIHTFKMGLPIIPSIKLAKANPHIGMADLVKRVNDLNHAQRTFNLHPSCEITYNRRAYSDGQTDSGLRVTFDEGVGYKVLDVVPTAMTDKLIKEEGQSDLNNMVSGYDPEHHMVLEVKHHGTTPDWLAKFLNDHKIVKTSFSKYCYSMAKHAGSRLEKNMDPHDIDKSKYKFKHAKDDASHSHYDVHHEGRLVGQMAINKKNKHPDHGYLQPAFHSHMEHVGNAVKAFHIARNTSTDN